MRPMVEVPLNRMLADLDKTLRGLMRDELERHGFDDVEIAFDAPSRERSGELFKTAVTVFVTACARRRACLRASGRRCGATNAPSKADPNGHGGESSAVSE